MACRHRRVGAVLRRAGFDRLPGLRARPLTSASRRSASTTASAMGSSCECRQRVRARDRAPLPGLGDAARARSYDRHRQLRRHRRHRADLRRRDRDARLRPALHLRAGTQSRVLHLCARRSATGAGCTALVGGMCETDYSGYPDCRDATLRALEQAIRLGTEIPFAIETPLMWLTKAETWALAVELGGDGLGRSHHRGHPHLLSRRARHAARLGLWLRRLPRLRAPRQGLCRMARLFARRSSAPACVKNRARCD